MSIDNLDVQKFVMILYLRKETAKRFYFSRPGSNGDDLLKLCIGHHTYNHPIEVKNTEP